MANLQDVLNAQPDVIDFLRNQQAGPNVYPGVPAEYTNWRSEQAAWAKTAVLFNQSYHMVELMIEGPGAFAMLEALGINSFKNYKPGKAKQWVPCTAEGYVIGDVILFYLEENKFNPGRPRARHRVGRVSRLDRQVGRQGHPRRAHRAAHGRQAPPLSLPAPGSQRHGDPDRRAGL